VTEQTGGTRRHRFLDASIDLPANLTEAQLDGRACVRCGDEHSIKRPVEAWSEQSAQLFECVDVEACAKRSEAS
jgi:Zn ribbon nucleic-acid-binding protein